jgi:hypothetical protein
MASIQVLRAPNMFKLHPHPNNESTSRSTDQKIVEVPASVVPVTPNMVVGHPMPPPPPCKRYRTKYRLPKGTEKCVYTRRMAGVDLNAFTNRRPTSNIFPKRPPMHRGGEADNTRLSSSVIYLIQLPAEAVPTTSTAGSAAAPSYWPCLVFSTIAHASKLHYEYYKKQEAVQLQLTKQAANDMLNLSLKNLAENNSRSNSSSSNNNSNNQTFKVVLPLRDSNGCYPPLIDVNGSSALNSWDFIMTRYKQELNQSRRTNPALFAALQELGRLLICKVGTTEKDTLKRKRESIRDDMEQVLQISLKTC